MELRANKVKIILDLKKEKRVMKTRKTALMTLAAVISACFIIFSVGCGGVGARVRQESMMSYQIDYRDAFREVINSCRDLNLVVNRTDKDAGQIACLKMGSFLGLVGAEYIWEIVLEIDKNSKLRNINIKVSTTGPVPGHSDEKFTEFISQYLAAFKKRLDVK